MPPIALPCKPWVGLRSVGGREGRKSSGLRGRDQQLTDWGNFGRKRFPRVALTLRGLGEEKMGGDYVLTAPAGNP